MKTYNHISQTDYESVSGPDWPSFLQFQQHKNIPKFVYEEINSMLRPIEGFTNPSFCVNPFYAWEPRLKTPCCLLPENSNIEKIKNQMLNNIRPEECFMCWNLEDNGLVSDRIIKNATTDFYIDRDLEFIIDDARQGKNKIINYKIDTNNTCNAACVTCDSSDSSTWGELERQNGQTPSKNWQIKSKDMHNVIDYANAKSIIFRGGEPTLSKTNFWILEQLIEHGNTKCFISFVTNGSFSINQDQLRLLKQFSTINFTFSIDGIGPVFEYMRWPLKWNTIVDNISWCKLNGFLTSSNHTVSNINLMYLEDTVNWFKQNNVNYTLNLVYKPEYFKYNVLTNAIREKIKQRWKTGQYDGLLKNNGNQNELFEQCKLILAQQDSWKKISINDYLPEFAKFL